MADGLDQRLYAPHIREISVTYLQVATPEAEVRAANLDYLDSADVDIAAWSADPEALVVHDAGEELHRLRTG